MVQEGDIHTWGDLSFSPERRRPSRSAGRGAATPANRDGGGEWGRLRVAEQRHWYIHLFFDTKGRARDGHFKKTQEEGKQKLEKT